MKQYLFLLISTFLTVNAFSQLSKVNQSNFAEINGKVLDADTKLPLSFTNIGIISTNRGTVSNENGQYRLDATDINITDTVIFQYMGYKEYKVTVYDLKIDSIVYLHENVISISDFIVYGNELDAKAIVKKIIPNKEKNYRSTPLKSRMFIRDRYATTVLKLKIKSLKNSFDQLDDNTAKMIENSVPKEQLSYTDFYGDVFSNNDTKIDKDSCTKTSSIKIISLKDNQDYSEIETVFKNLFSNAKDDEYFSKSKFFNL